MSHRWTMYDPVTTVTETFEMNPRSGGSPQRRRNVNGTPTLAPDGQAAITEGQRPVPTSTVGGEILTEAQYRQLDAWATHPSPLQLTDDLGRVFTIIITEFSPERQWSYSRPWKHTFSMTYMIIAEA